MKDGAKFEQRAPLSAGICVAGSPEARAIRYKNGSPNEADLLRPRAAATCCGSLPARVTYRGVSGLELGAAAAAPDTWAGPDAPFACRRARDCGAPSNFLLSSMKSGKPLVVSCQVSVDLAHWDLWTCNGHPA